MNGFESALSLAASLLGVVTAPVGYGVCVWLLAIVFVWSGVAKLRRPALAAMAMMDFGVLRRLRPRLGGALGAAELLLALALTAGVLPGLTLPITAGVLWLFVLLIARSLLSGEEFACFCFGDSDSRLSRLTLVRTAALALVASALAVATPAESYAALDGAYALQAVTAAALVGVIVLGGMVPKLLRWNNESYMVGDMEVNE